MKFLDRLFVLLFNLCLLLVSITLPVFALTASPSFYHTQFQATGIYATQNADGEKTPTTIYFIDGNSNLTAQFTDEQIDVMVDHIISYLFTDQESFVLVMDDVLLNGTSTDGVSVFGEVAVGHMVDVKNLFTFFIVLTVALLLVLLVSGVYLFYRRAETGKLLLKYSLLFYGFFIALLGAFCLWVISDLNAAGRAITVDNFLDRLWSNFHHILFPFQADKFSNSFFNDTLTQILTLDFFMAAVFTVLLVAGIVLAVWFAFCIFTKIRSKKGVRIAPPKAKRKGWK